jgi:hypothetical protein
MNKYEQRENRTGAPISLCAVGVVGDDHSVVSVMGDDHSVVGVVGDDHSVVLVRSGDQRFGE